MDYMDRVPQGDPEDSRDLFLEWTEFVARTNPNLSDIAWQYEDRFLSIPTYSTTFVQPSTSVVYLD